MGGGMLIRTVGRAAGSTTPTSSSSFCSACSGRVPRPSSLRTGVCQNATWSHQAACTGTESEPEDWEFADDSVFIVGDGAHRSRFTQDSRWLLASVSSLPSEPSRCDETPPSSDFHEHAFGFPPTFEEARAATTDLQAAFMESIAIKDGINIKTSVSKTSEQEELTLQASHEVSDCDQETHSDGWIEPHISSNFPLSQVVKNPVYEAFQLLQSNAHVQDAVMSLASDSNVWHAMMKNKEMQQLRQKLEESEDCLTQREEDVDIVATHEPQSKKQGDNPFGGAASALHAILQMSMGIVCRVQNELAKLVMNIMSMLNRPNHSSAKATTDNASASTMMLAVLVVVVVLVKRLTV